ncbi:MAG: DNA adenine methylase [Corynebacterium variabile]|uniref:DNA adenine methylase n=1 Tax=Corynebacterium variabile TaxID=1727 RepID=UPI003F925533
MPTTKTPLRYPGGKSQLRPFVKDIIARLDAEISTYFEPFAGGAGVAIDLLLTGTVSDIIINDADPGIYSFWNAVVNDTDRLCSDIEYIDVSLNTWKRQRDVRSRMDYSDMGRSVYNYDLAFATFFLNRTNRSGIIEGGCIGGLTQSGKYKLDCRFNKDTLIKKIRLIGARRDSISVLGMDGIRLLDSGLVAEIVDRDKVFMFADPPYVGQGSNLYFNFFSEKQHRLLRDAISESGIENWILTYDDNPLVREVWGGDEIKTISINYSANIRGRHSEILVNSESVRSLISWNDI